MPIVLRCALALLCLFAAATAFAQQTRTLAAEAPRAGAARRIALVIGVDRYQNVPALVNAVADAETMATTLNRVGYEVRVVHNPTQREAQDELLNVAQRVQGGDEVVFFFSGHGVQINGLNYLLPRDVRSSSDGQVRNDALSLNNVLDELRERKPRFLLAVIDACRDNPFPSTGRAIGSRGLARVSGADGQMIIYAAGEGQRALDRLGPNDKVRNGLFTRVFAQQMVRPGVPVHEVLRGVRDEVYRLAQGVDHVQVPAIYDQMLGSFYFVPPGSVTPATPSAPSGGGLSMEDLERENRQRNEWAQWQQRMQADFDRVAGFQASADLQVQAWKRFLQTWATNNPMSDADEQLRQQAQVRLARAEREVQAAARPVLVRELADGRKQIDFATLPLADAIVWSNGTGQRRIAMFADPNCGYCKRFDNTVLQQLRDVTVYTFLMPILGTDSSEKSRAIWCAKDRAATWQAWMRRGEQPMKEAASCDSSAIERNLALSRRIGINSTPSWLAEDGTITPGAVELAEVERRLQAASPATSTTAQLPPAPAPVQVPAGAARWPTGPVTLVVPFAAGGPTDALARHLAAALQRQSGATVVIENVGGAGGTLGAAKVAKAAPDGRTLLFHHMAFATSAALYRNATFRPLEDFEFAGLVNEIPMALVGRPNLPANNLAELQRWLQANAGKVTLANAGIGSASHLCGLALQQALRTDVTTVPYRGTAPAMSDLQGGQVDLLCDQSTNLSAQMAAQRVKSFALASRTAANVPAFSGLPQLPGVDVNVWHGVYAPRGTPAALVAGINAAIQNASRDSELVRSSLAIGAVPVTDTRATTAGHRRFVEEQVASWGHLIRTAGVYAD